MRPGRTWGLASGGMDAAVVFWQRTGRGRQVRIHPDTSDEASGTSGGPQLLNPPFVYAVAYSADGLSLAAGLGDGTVGIFDAEDAELRQRLRGGHAAAVCQVEFTPPGLFSAGNDQALCFWRWHGGEMALQPEVRVRHEEKVNWITWAGNLLFVAGTGNDIVAYDGFRI